MKRSLSWYGHQFRRQLGTDSAKRVPESADVVVIGGGSIGCNTLYHLTKLGVKNVVLLERDRLTCGTTWHTAGLLWSLRPSDTDCALVARTRDLNVRILKEETGMETGWNQNGGLLIGSTQNRWNEIKRLWSLAKSQNIESYLVSPAEIKELYPLMNVDDLYGGLYNPTDGTMDPSSLMNALTRAATMNGAKVIEGCTVTDVHTKVNDFGSKQVTAVETQLGTIRTNAVVACGGAWTPKIGAMVGAHIPLVPFKHSYVITENIPGVANTPNCRDPDHTYYLRLQGTALEVGGFERAPVFADDLPDEFSFSLFDLDYEAFGMLMEGAIHRVPTLATTGIKKEVSGPEAFTPDHQPLFGEAPQCRGFYMGCGLNSQGMMYGGGLGQQLAHWVVHGRPELHMHKFDIRRHSPETLKDIKWIRDKSHEGLLNNYSIAWAHDEPLAGRLFKMDPLFDALANQGAVFEERMGWERPSWFAPDGKAAIPLPYDYYGEYGHPKNEADPYWDRLRLGYSHTIAENEKIIEAESLNCRQRVSLFNMSSFGKYYLTGPDAQKAADWLFTADLRKDPGYTVFSLCLNDRAGIEGDLTVSVLPSGGGSGPHDPVFQEPLGFYILAGGSMRQQAKSHILNECMDQGFNVSVADVTDKVCMLSLQGPYSREVLQPLVNIDLANEAFPFSTNQLAEVAGYKCRILRVSFVGELGYEIHVPSNDALAVYNALMDNGMDYGIMNAGYRALGALSAEKGFFLWNEDLRITDDPLKFGLGFACKLKTDIPFKGRAKLEQIKQKPLSKRMVCLLTDEQIVMHRLESVYRDGKIVGLTRRGEFAYSLEKSLGWAMVERDDGGVVDKKWLESGNFEVEILGEKQPVKAAIRSPFDPKSDRMKGIYNIDTTPKTAPDHMTATR